MLRRTHFTLGIASALVVTHPETVPGVIAAITGGGLGGWIVDIDCKRTDLSHEKICDILIDILFIGAFIILDFFIGNGMCQYISDNLSIFSIGAFCGFLALSFIAFKTAHRTFSHSILALVLFGTMMCFFCQPVTFPFVIGYASHMIADLFNKKGEQLLFPIKKRFCFSLCASNQLANKVLYLVSLMIGIIVGALFFIQALLVSHDNSFFISKLLSAKLMGLNALQLYLLFINAITFLGFQRNWKLRSREELKKKDNSLRIQLEFEVWFLDLLVFLGGGVGMLVALVIHLAYPSGYNGNWWAFCYSSILLWYTVYCCICNPFGHNLDLAAINWLPLVHIPLLAYVISINFLTILLMCLFRKKHLNEYSGIHTLLLFAGALGGTLGGFVTAFAVRRDISFNYATIGFPIMMISQIAFIVYMMAAGIF